GGQILLNGVDLLDYSERAMQQVRWKQISMIFQGAMNALNPVRTVGNQIAEPIAYHAVPVGGVRLPPTRRGATSDPYSNAAGTSANGGQATVKGTDPTRTIGSQIADAIVAHEPIGDKRILRARVAELLDLVGINPSRQDEYPHQYSGGMRQRAMIAMALACDPAIIIADEPTTALDVMVQAQILELLTDLCRTLGLSVLFVTHDLGVVAEICDSVLVMYGGVVAEYSDVDTVYNGPRHPYTQELLKAFPDLSRPDERLQAIPGYPPRLDALPAGCRFAPRCPAAYARCHVERPPLYHLGEFHEVSCHLVDLEA
ncbi:MAG: ABC transporter ATP-binding protein, partial [Caldilineaceae bacterium]|nr:ABC transporter ATP-binding protein [Caldilineaceae bacterium]